MDPGTWKATHQPFIIGEDGNIYEGGGWTKIGDHTFGFNKISLGISIIGNFMTTTPNSKAQTAALSLIQCSLLKGYLASNYTLKGHRQLGQTTCPGDALYEVIKQWLRWN
ncbi:peptidoglycan recognition protein 5 [Chiloscyllium punctatum]|uniref:peptidoglycan recognition protein 5 n=1 Tax=Chiloscyllium punctatum TaxID=137246 RepID=UPI003B635977